MCFLKILFAFTITFYIYKWNKKIICVITHPHTFTKCKTQFFKFMFVIRKHVQNCNYASSLRLCQKFQFRFPYMACEERLDIH